MSLRSKKSKQRSMNNNNNSQSSNLLALAKAMKPEIPGPYNAQKIMKMRIRYVASGQPGDFAGTAYQFAITRELMLQRLAISGSVGSTTYGRICQSVRLDKVEIWGVGIRGLLSGSGVGGGTSGMYSVAINWGGPDTPDVLHTANGTATFPPRLTSVPPKNSYASMWSNKTFNESDSLCGIQMVYQDIIDVYFSYILDNGSMSVFSGSASLNPGFFYMTLDTVTGGSITPLDLSFI